MKNSLRLAYLAASIVALTQLCCADALYTTTTSVEQNGSLQPISSVTTYLKDDLERQDFSQDIGPFHTLKTTIFNRAKREQITLDSKLKIYVMDALDSISDSASASGNTKSSKTSVGTMILTLGAKFLGLEKLMDRPVRHYSTSMAIESSGCCGTGKSKVKSEVWMADVQLPALAVGANSTDWKSALAASYSDCRIDFQRKGDIEGYEAAQKGLALKTITFDENGKMLMTSQVTALSFPAIAADNFAIPSDFKKVSRAQYDGARTQAMMKAIQHSGK